MPEAEKRHIYAEVLKTASKAIPPEAGVAKEDIASAFASFLLVFISGIPVIAPFFIARSLEIAIRISNLVAIAMLFIIGFEWAGYTGKNRLKAGITMVLIGSAIVGVTVALGG